MMSVEVTPSGGGSLSRVSLPCNEFVTVGDSGDPNDRLNTNTLCAELTDCRIDLIIACRSGCKSGCKSDCKSGFAPLGQSSCKVGYPCSSEQTGEVSLPVQGRQRLWRRRLERLSDVRSAAAERLLHSWLAAPRSLHPGTSEKRDCSTEDFE